MRSLNRTEIIGHLGQDPELRFTGDETPGGKLLRGDQRAWGAGTESDIAKTDSRHGTPVTEEGT